MNDKEHILISSRLSAAITPTCVRGVFDIQSVKLTEPPQHSRLFLLSLTALTLTSRADTCTCVTQAFSASFSVCLCPIRPSGDRPPRGRGGGRGGRGGRGRGMGRGDGFDSRGKRDFDRHSGSDKS